MNGSRLSHTHMCVENGMNLRTKKTFLAQLDIFLLFISS